MRNQILEYDCMAKLIRFPILFYKQKDPSVSKADFGEVNQEK